MNWNCKLAAVALGACFGTTALADGAIAVADPQVRLVPPTAANSALFMKLSNHGAAERRLVRAESSVAKVVELHTVITEGGMMKMRPVPAIPIKPHADTVLKPGDYHVMLIGLTRPLTEGDEIAFTLGFDDGSTQTIKAPVRRIEMKMGSAIAPMKK